MKLTSRAFAGKKTIYFMDLIYFVDLVSYYKTFDSDMQILKFIRNEIERTNIATPMQIINIKQICEKHNLTSNMVICQTK